MPNDSLPSAPGNYNGGVINDPQINAEGKPTQRSIRDVEQARDIVKLVIQAGRNRSIVNSRIQAKANAERPYDNSRLEAEGLGWKQNFTSKPLPTIIGKVAPRFVEAVNGLKYFTNSTLSDKWENSAEKSEKFQDKITKVIRGKKGWRTLLEDIAFNNALFGYTAVAWLDEFTFMPIHFKQDEFFLPDGTKQETAFCQVAVLKEVYLPHELFAEIKDRESAELAGWNIKNTITAINNASSQQERDRINVGGTLEFWYQNAIRELTLGASYMAGANVVVVYTLLAREVTGKISHYRMAGEGMLSVFEKEDRFNSAEECLAFYSYEKGNGTMHGSKGIGRDVYELAGMIDRTRNEIVDRAILSGKTFVQGDIKRIHTFKMSLVGAMAIVPSGWTFLEQKIDGNIEPFLKLDAYFGMLVDQLIGNVSPPTQIQGEAFRSPAAWNLLAAREEEGKDFRIARFLEQFVCMISTMQKRICDPETVDEAAKQAQKELLESMTREEIDELCNQPAAGAVRDLTPVQRQMIALIAGEKKGNPLYNQRRLEVEDVTARVGADFARRVILPENDPTEQAEQLRLQQMELTLLQAGQAVPVSPRDNHVIHLSVLMPVAEQMGAAILQGQMDTATFEILIAHLTEHAARAESQGVSKEEIKPALDVAKNAGKIIAKLKELDAQAAQLGEASQLHDQDAASMDQLEQATQQAMLAGEL